MRVTAHGSDRIRERLGVPKKAVARMAAKALHEGATHSDLAGQMRRYLDSVFLEYRTANNLRIHAQHLFLFNGETLITVWRLPNRFKNARPSCAAPT